MTDPETAIDYLRTSVADGEHWYIALLKAMAGAEAAGGVGVSPTSSFPSILVSEFSRD